MNTKNGNVLIVDDDADVLKSASLYLKMHLNKIDTETNPEKLPQILKKTSYDVILLDMNFKPGNTGGLEGFEWLKKIMSIDHNAVVVLISAYGDVDMAVGAIKAGAFDFILKPWQNEKLLATINAALNLRQSKIEIQNTHSDHTSTPIHRSYWI